MCKLEKKIGMLERKHKKTIENSQIYFKAHRVLFVHSVGECELDSIAYLLNRKCDSVVPLPVRTIRQSLGCRAGKALSPPSLARHCVQYAAPVWVQADGKLHYV